MAQATKSVNKVESQGVKSMTQSTKVMITLDTTFDSILKSDLDGNVLLFSGDPGRFRELSAKELEQLSPGNRQRYGYAKEEFEYLSSEAKTSGLMAQFEVDPSRSSAGSRLEIQNQDPRYDYYWKTPENLSKFVANGGEIVPASGRERTLSNDSAKRGAHELSHLGKTELVLCRMPKTRSAELKAQGDVRFRKLMQKGSEDFAEIVAEAKAEVVESKED